MGKKAEHKSWLRRELTSSWESLAILDGQKLRRLFDFYSDPCEGMREITSIIIEKPYASPKAELIRALRKELTDKSCGQQTRDSALEQLEVIKDCSRDSEIIQKFCMDGIIK